jgi:uncharacterized protein (TIGR02266 family)
MHAEETETDAATPPILPTREHERIELAIDVTLASGSNFWTGLTRNVSEGGLFVATDELQPPGSILRFQFRMLPDPQLHEVLGEVRWVRHFLAASDDFPAGMGVRFVDLPDALRETIERFIAEKRDSLFMDLDDDLG